MYISQSDIKPIVAKEYLVKHWKSYNVVDTKENFIALLNILQACGESLDSLHHTHFNGKDEFCDIFHSGGWNSDRDIADSLLEFCSFYTESEFIDLILERKEDYDNLEEYVEDMRLEATDEINGNNDVQITKTNDGYVRRVWY